MSKLSNSPRKLIGAICVIALVTSAVATNTSAQSGAWTTKVSMPTPRYSAPAAVVEGTLYVVGGDGVSPTGRIATMEAYDPKSNTWTVKAPMPTARCCAAAATLDGILYVVGGVTPFPQTVLATHEAYNPKTGSWTTKAPLPTPRANMALVVADGVLYAIGGIGGKNSVEAYDPKTNVWLSKSPMPSGRELMAVSVIDGLVYVAGGLISRSRLGAWLEITGALEVYDPKSNTWSTKTPMPTARAATACGVLDGKMYVVGGSLLPDYTTQTTVEIYDPKTESWSSQIPMPTRRAEVAAGVVDNTLYVVGGLQGNSGIVGVNEAFSPFLHIGIDIKPGEASNTINLKSQGVVPVAILGSATFDPLSVDPATVTLAGAPVATRGRGVPMTSQGDFNRDGYLDLLLHFRTQDLKLTFASTEAVLYGETTTGQRIRGADSVRIVQFTVKGPAPRVPFERPRRAPALPLEP